MKRLEDWPTRLSDFLAARSTMPFVWGSNDCVLLCADAVAALTGDDLAADVRGKWASEAEAQAMIAGYGTSVEDVFEAKLGESLPYIGMAGRGDIVSFEHDGRICGGVVDDSGRRAAVLTEGGLLRVPVSRCRKGWSY